MQNIRPISALLAIALAFVVFDRCLAAEGLQAIEIPGDRAFMESITAGPDGILQIRVCRRVIAATPALCWRGRIERRARGRAMRNRLGERTNLRSFPPSHAATADGCVVKHKIK